MRVPHIHIWGTRYRLLPLGSSLSVPPVDSFHGRNSGVPPVSFVTGGTVVSAPPSGAVTDCSTGRSSFSSSRGLNPREEVPIYIPLRRRSGISNTHTFTTLCTPISLRVSRLVCFEVKYKWHPQCPANCYFSKKHTFQTDLVRMI